MATLESPNSPLAVSSNAAMPSRDRLMSLTTIRPGEDYRVTKTSYVHKPLDITDIEGAQPRHREYHPYIQEEIDVGKRQHAVYYNKPDHTLSCKDIEGAYPRTGESKSNRMVDPLDPEYKYPSYVPAPAYELRFLRDAMDITDIKGTSSTPLYQGEAKPIVSMTQIPNRPKKEKIPRKEMFDVSDINKKPKRLVRQSNPCDPTYNWEKAETWKDLPKTTAKEMEMTALRAQTGRGLPAERLPSSLRTDDIEGASPNREKVRDVRNTNYVGDIDGAYNPKHLKAAGSPGMQKGGYILEKVDYVQGEEFPPLQHPRLPDTEHKAGIKCIPKKERTFVSEIMKEHVLPGPSLDKYSGAKKVLGRKYDPEIQAERALGDPIFHADITGLVKEEDQRRNPSVNSGSYAGSRGAGVGRQANGVGVGGSMPGYSQTVPLKTRTRRDAERELVASLPRY